jgi:hypothetical protein
MLYRIAVVLGMSARLISQLPPLVTGTPTPLFASKSAVGGVTLPLTCPGRRSAVDGKAAGQTACGFHGGQLGCAVRVNKESSRPALLTLEGERSGEGPAGTAKSMAGPSTCN